MRFLHTSDLHIGKRVNEFSMLEEQKYILSEILRIVDSENIDAVIIAGDIYDKSVPTTEAVSLFDDFLTSLAEKEKYVFVISGNHDSAERIAFGSKLMKKGGVYLSPLYNGNIEPRTITDVFGEINVYLLPFLKAANVRRFYDEEIKNTDQAIKAVTSSMDIDVKKRNILVAHQFVAGASTCESEEISVGGTDEVSYKNFEKFDYVALGHIHGPQKMGSENIRYSGTPLKYSFSEVNHKKSAVIVDVGEKGNVNLNYVPLVPQHDMRKIKGKFDELMLRENYLGTNVEDYLQITLTDEEDVIDAVQKLKTIYPNLLKLDYDNKRTRNQGKITEGAAMEEKSPKALFAEFFEKQNGAEMSHEQEEYIDALIKEVF